MTGADTGGAVKALLLELAGLGAGGTGGAKLARGMLDVAGDELVVIANTGDDVEIHDRTAEMPHLHDGDARPLAAPVC